MAKPKQPSERELARRAKQAAAVKPSAKPLKTLTDDQRKVIDPAVQRANGLRRQYEAHLEIAEQMILLVYPNWKKGMIYNTADGGIYVASKSVETASDEEVNAPLAAGKAKTS